MCKVTHRFQSLRAASLLIALTCGAAAFAAQPAPLDADMTAVKVTYGDLNLAREQGKQALLARIRSAARRACFAHQVDFRDLRAFANERLCEKTAIEQAVPSVYQQTQSTNGYTAALRNPPARRDGTPLGQ